MSFKTVMRNFLRRTGAFILVFALSIISLSFIAHIPAVQKFGIQHLTGILSNVTGTRVEVGKFDFNFFSSLNLYNVHVESPGVEGDTLLYGGALEVRFANLVSLVQRKVVLKDVRLYDVDLRFARHDTADVSTLTMLFDNLSSNRQRQDSTRANFDIVARHLSGRNWSVEYFDDHKNTRQTYRLNSAEIAVESIDLDTPLIALAGVELNGLDVEIHKFAEPDRESIDTIEEDSIKRKPLKITAQRFVIDGSSVKMRNETSPAGNVEGIDFKDLLVEDILIDVADFGFQDLNFEGKVNMLAFREKSGFRLDSLVVNDAEVKRSGIALNGMSLRTRRTNIGDTLRFNYDSYEAFKNFANDVYIFANLDNARIAVNDLLYAVPPLRNSAFFVHNENNQLRLDGVIRGTVNSLRARDLRGRIGDFVFEGDFRSRDLSIRNEQFLNLRLRRATASAEILRELIPGLRLTSQYDLLGEINFSGRFDGFLQDFVADGQVTTNLGAASLDMRLDLFEGLTDARYSGGISLDSFDVGQWSRSPDLGRISAVMQVYSGKGLTAESASAQLGGSINLLEFKGYSYENAVLNGVLDKNYFDGSLEIDDNNIDLVFSGIVDLRGDNPSFDFETVIDTLNLTALNIVKDTFELAGAFEVEGVITPSSGIEGFARASEVYVKRGRDEEYLLDTIGVYSNPVGQVNHFYINSDYISGNIDGQFSFNTFYPQLAQFLQRRYPKLARNLEYKPDTSGILPEMQFNIELRQPTEWSGIFGVKELEFDRLMLTGGIDLERDSISLLARSPDIAKGGMRLKYAELVVDLDEDFSSVSFSSDTFSVGGLNIDSLSFALNGVSEDYNWALGAKDIYESLLLDLNGSFAYDTAGNYQIGIDHDNSVVFDPNWEIQLANRIAWGKGYIDIDSLLIANGDRRIEISDINRKGLVLDIDNFEASYLDVIWDYDKLDFDGPYSVDLYVDNLFDRNVIHGELAMDSLIINGDNYGPLSARVDLEGAQQPIQASASIGQVHAPILAAEAWFDPSVKNEDQNLGGEIELFEFPGRFLEYFLGESVTNTQGTASGSITVYGDTSTVVIDGSALVKGASSKVVVLGETYTIDDFEVKLTSDFIDLSNAVVHDSEGNTAYVSGGLRHELLKDMFVDIELTSERIIGLKLPKERGALFYGKGVGATDVTFRGLTREGPVITVNAVSDQGTRIYLPLDEGSEASETFLRFVTRDSLGNITVEQQLEGVTGVELEMNLTITPQAQVDIIFNEYTRDILQGNGEGNIQINLNRAGDFTLYGGVEVAGGRYLFTNLAVNKPFIIRPGGTIRWSGDPYDAQIDIVADYQGLRASLTTLLEEYLVNATPNAQQEARQLTNVQLELLLTGSLLEPNIDFNIEFPDVRGELSGYLESKMTVLRGNQNALNEQVFGLLWAGTFLPSNVTRASGSSSLATVGIANTLSEFISSQLSFFISDFLQGAIEDVDFISGIDFDVGYNQSFDYLEQSATYSEWEVSVRNRLFNDRFIVDVGGSYVVDNPVVTQGAYFAGDYALEYVLTKDRRLKVRFYHRNEETIEGRRNKTGIGLSYRREFDSFGEWLRGLDQDAKKVRSEDATRDGEQDDLQN